MACDMFRFIIYTVVDGPMCIVGFIANIICYNIIKRDSGKKHHAATFLLQALAVADNLVLTFSFINMSIIYGLLPMFNAFKGGKIRYVLMYTHMYGRPFYTMALAATVWTTVLIANNRYIAVCKPLDAQRLSSLKKTKIQVAVVFILAIIFTLPQFFEYTIIYPEDYPMSRAFLKQTSIGPSSLFGKVYAVGSTICLLILPLILLIVFNSKIIWELKKADKCKDAIRQNGNRSENNITVVMVVIVIVFLICNIPAHISELAGYFIKYKPCSAWYVFGRVSIVLLVANSSANFLVYYVLRKSFRRAFRNAL